MSDLEEARRMDDKKLHERLMNIHSRMGQGEKRIKVVGTDQSGLRKAHQFIRDSHQEPKTWEERLALKYYSRLFREFAIADLSRYTEKLIGFRWRVEKEVLEGKGQFICAAKGCTATLALETYEVQFAYVEASVKKEALVKVKLCPDCGLKLNYGRGEKSYHKIRKRDREEVNPDHDPDAAGSLKAHEIVKAAELLQLALGAKSLGGAERSRLTEDENEKNESVENSQPQLSLTSDEGMWGLKKDEGPINAEGVDVDAFLDEMFA